MQADRHVDAGRAVSTVEQLMSEFAQRQRNAIKDYEAWRVRQQLRTTSSGHLDQLRQHAAEVLIMTKYYRFTAK